MPSEHRIITVAPGHDLRVRLAPVAARPGCVAVKATRRAPFEIAQQRWDEGRAA